MQHLNLRLIDDVPQKLPSAVFYDNEEILEPDFNENDVFEKYLNHFCDLVKCALGTSIPSGYVGTEDFICWPFNESEEPEYGENDIYQNMGEDEDDARVKVFYNIHDKQFRIQELMSFTGLHQQQAKAFPRHEMKQKVTELMNAVKKSLREFNAFVKIWNEKIRESKGIFFELASPNFIRTKKILSQIYHQTLFLLLWISRYFMSTSYLYYYGVFKEQASLFEHQTNELEAILADFVDGNLPESQAEKRIKTQINTLYLTWRDIKKYYNSLVSFGTDFEQQPGLKSGFILHPEHQEGFQLSQMWENHVLNLIWRVSSLPWKGGEAVVRSIINQGTLEEVNQQSVWLGKRFAFPLHEDLSDKWKVIAMDTLAEFDLSQFHIIGALVKNIQLDKSELRLQLNEPTFESVLPKVPPMMSRTVRGEITEDVSEDVYENRSSSISSNSFPSQQHPRTSRITTGGSHEASRCISGVSRILQRIRDIVDSDKHSVDFKKIQIQKAFESLDRVAVNADEKVTADQWAKMEDLTLEVEEANQQNLEALRTLDTAANNKHQLPRGSLGKFSGSATNFLEFKKNMESLLSNYSSEDLKLSTLRQQIEGPEKKQILRRIENATSLQNALQILETFYGGFDILLPKLKRNLEELPSSPTFIETETKNIEELLNFLNLLEKHEKTAIISDEFIFTFQHKLGDTRRLQLRDSEISTFAGLKDFLTKALRTNLNLSLSMPVSTGRKFKNVKINESVSTVSDGKGKIKEKKCLICLEQDNHWTHSCPQLSEKSDLKDRKKLVMDCHVCLKCLGKYEPGHKCPVALLKFLCKHKINKHVCGCMKARVQNNTMNCGPSSSSSTLNGVPIGAVAFLSERISFIDSDGVERKELVTYDSFASHGTISEKLAKSIGAKIENLDSPIKTNTFVGSKTEEGRKCLMNIKTKSDLEDVEFLVARKYGQYLSPIKLKVSPDLCRKYNIQEDYNSSYGWSSVIIAMDFPKIFPEILVVSDGLMIARSRITGNILVAGGGKMVHHNGQNVSQVKVNRSVVTVDVINNAEVGSVAREATFSPHAKEDGDRDLDQISLTEIVSPESVILSISEPKDQDLSLGQELDNTCGSDQVSEAEQELDNKCGSEQDQGLEQELDKGCKEVDICECHNNLSQVSEAAMMKENSTDSVNVSAIKHCSVCRNCTNCSSLSLTQPRNQEALDLEELIERNVQWDEGKKRYVAHYPHNALLKQLPTHRDAAMKAMQSLERKLQKHPMWLDQFNEKVLKFKKQGVFLPVSDFPELKNMQESFIILTYSLNKSDANGKCKLRPCLNNSFGSTSCPMSQLSGED